MKEREAFERATMDLMEDKVKLSAEQEAWLDTKLDEQTQVAQMVRALPLDEPELGWRSELSGKLPMVARQNERSRKLLWVFRPALGMALAGALAITFMFKGVPDSPRVAAPRVEDQILIAHQESVALGQFWGGIRDDEETRIASAPAASEYRWDETDLGTL